MSLRTPSKTGAVRDCCVEGRRRVITVQKPRAVGLLPVCLTVKPVGEPDALIGHDRFDERGWETERCRMAQATAPILDSTFCDLATGRKEFRSRGKGGYAADVTHTTESGPKAVIKSLPASDITRWFPALTLAMPRPPRELQSAGPAPSAPRGILSAELMTRRGKS